MINAVANVNNGRSVSPSPTKTIPMLTGFGLARKIGSVRLVPDAIYVGVRMNRSWKVKRIDLGTHKWSGKYKESRR